MTEFSPDSIYPGVTLRSAKPVKGGKYDNATVLATLADEKGVLGGVIVASALRGLVTVTAKSFRTYFGSYTLTTGKTVGAVTPMEDHESAAADRILNQLD